MARSFHVTSHELERELDADYSSADEKHERLQALIRERKKKREAKRLALVERTPAPPVSSTPRPVDAIPIEIIDRDLHVFYPATADDLRDVIRLLPAGVLDGLARIRLLLGRERQFEAFEDDAQELVARDPWFDRPGDELFPGVFVPPLRGSCSRNDPSTIELYGVACGTPLERATPLAWLLKLRFLATFVHEIAHHDDWRRRVARGRWTMLNSEKAEQYAVVTAAGWVRDSIVPFLRAREIASIERLEAWIEAEVGARLPLELYLGGFKWDDRGRVQHRFLTSVATQFEELLNARSKGAPPEHARLDFAKWLQLGPFEEESIRVLEAIVRENPAHAVACAYVARAHLYRGRVGEGLTWATRAVELDPGCGEGWGALATSRQRSGDWPGAIEASDRALACTDRGVSLRRNDFITAIRGRVELGRLDEAWALLPQLEAEPSRAGRSSRDARVLRALILLRREEFAEASELAEEGTVVVGGTSNRLRLGVWIEAGLRLGRSGEIGIVPKWLFPELRFIGHGAWADRLEAMLAHAGFQPRRDGAWRPPGKCAVRAPF